MVVLNPLGDMMAAILGANSSLWTMCQTVASIGKSMDILYKWKYARTPPAVPTSDKGGPGSQRHRSTTFPRHVGSVVIVGPGYS